MPTPGRGAGCRACTREKGTGSCMLQRTPCDSREQPALTLFRQSLQNRGYNSTGHRGPCGTNVGLCEPRPCVSHLACSLYQAVPVAHISRGNKTETCHNKSVLTITCSDTHGLKAEATRRSLLTGYVKLRCAVCRYIIGGSCGLGPDPRTGTDGLQQPA